MKVKIKDKFEQKKNINDFLLKTFFSLHDVYPFIFTMDKI